MKLILLCLFFLTGLSAASSVLKRAVLPSDEKKEIETVLARNDLLFNAFLKNDGPSLQKAAEGLSVFLSTTRNEKLKTLKLHLVDLKSMKSSLKREDNMTHYESFLGPLIQLVREYDLTAKFNIFYCPMVKKYWIQDIETNKEIKNVFAMEMLECGSQETHYK